MLFTFLLSFSCFNSSKAPIVVITASSPSNFKITSSINVYTMCRLSSNVKALPLILLWVLFQFSYLTTNSNSNQDSCIGFRNSELLQDIVWIKLKSLKWYWNVLDKYYQTLPNYSRFMEGFRFYLSISFSETDLHVLIFPLNWVPKRSENIWWIPSASYVASLVFFIMLWTNI